MKTSKRNTKFLVVIAGPTAVGKTSLSIRLAKHFQTEIVSADSRQVFEELTIGAAKPNPQELSQVHHHFIGTHSVTESYNAGRYEEEAIPCIESLFNEHDIVIMTGGSGLYINAVVNGIDALPEADPELRSKLNEQLKTEGLAALQEQLKTRDPEYYNEVDLANPHRIIRALEISILTEQPYSSLRREQKKDRHFTTIKIGLELPRELLYQRINERVDIMVKEGLVDEAKGLYPLRHLNALQTVGYKELFDYFDGNSSLEQAIDLIKQHTRNYAKRQLTWFKRDEEMKWFRPDEEMEIIRWIEGKEV